MYMTHDQQQCVLDCPAPYLNNSNSHICVCSLSALDGTTCVDACGGNQTTAAVPGSEAARQCVCQANYELLSDGKSCVCKLFGPDGKSCVRRCGAYTSRVPSDNDPDVERCMCSSGFEPAEDAYSCTCKSFLSADSKSCIAECPHFFVEVVGHAECVDSCPSRAPFHEASGRCVAECVGGTAVNGLCGKEKNTEVIIAVAIFSCVCLLGTIIAVVLICKIRAAKKAKLGQKLVLHLDSKSSSGAKAKSQRASERFNNSRNTSNPSDEVRQSGDSREIPLIGEDTRPCDSQSSAF